VVTGRGLGEGTRSGLALWGCARRLGYLALTVMTQKATSKKVAARDRVREIRARVDEEKAARERRLYEVVTAFHEARFERDEALASARRQEATMAERLGELLAMDEPLERAATLCDLSVSEARGLRSRCRGTDASTPGC